MFFSKPKRSYVIVFNHPDFHDVEVNGTLEKAQDEADKRITCTKKDVVIMLKERVAATRKWHDGEYTGDPKQGDPICYENVGYYSDWE